MHEIFFFFFLNKGYLLLGEQASWRLHLTIWRGSCTREASTTLIWNHLLPEWSLQRMDMMFSAQHNGPLKPRLLLHKYLVLPLTGKNSVYIPSCSIQILSYTCSPVSVSIFVQFFLQLMYILCHYHLFLESIQNIYTSLGKTVLLLYRSSKFRFAIFSCLLKFLASPFILNIM